MRHVVPRSSLTLVTATLVAVIASLTIQVSAQAGPDIAVIVHPGVALDGLSRAELRQFLLGESIAWTADLPAVVILRAPIAPEREAVTRVCDMTEAEFRQHWIGKVFRAERRQGPTITSSAESTVEAVSKTPGALALVPWPTKARDVKTLKIDGKLPGEAGYSVR